MVAQTLISKVTRQIETDELAKSFPEYWGLNPNGTAKVAKKRKDPLHSMRTKVCKVERAFRAFFDSSLEEAEDCNDFLGSMMQSGGGLLHVEV